MRMTHLRPSRYAGLATRNGPRSLAYAWVALTAAVLLHASDDSLSSRQSRQALDLDRADGYGVVCSPTDTQGLASISLDGVVNTTDGPLTVTDITAATPDGLTVVDWWLARDDEDSPGAMTGSWPHPVRPWHSTLQPADAASVVVTVQADDPTRPTSETALDLAFTTADGDSGRARTDGRLLTGPPSGCL